MDPASATIVAASIIGIATVASPWLRSRARRRQASQEKRGDDAVPRPPDRTNLRQHSFLESQASELGRVSDVCAWERSRSRYGEA
jgi:hypothetical protein